MILVLLKEQSGFTDSEKNLADFMLSHGLEMGKITISELAERTYSSPATITRFCRKLGMNGFRDFRILFLSEYEKSLNHEKVDINLPFSKNDSFELITKKMENLNAATISRVTSSFDYDQLKRIVYQMHDAHVINIYAAGMSNMVAQDFAVKLARLGKQVNIERDSTLLYAYAVNCEKEYFNLLISQSGETEKILKCGSILRKKGCRTVAITGKKTSTLASLCDEVIYVETDEDDSFAAKIESFASYYGVHFVLDCLYCYLYKTDYDRNVRKSEANVHLIEAEGRKQ